MKKLLLLTMCFVTSLVLLNCGEKSGGGGGGGGISLSASISGSVSSNVIAGSGNILPNGNMAMNMMASAPNPGACASSDYNVYKVGGDGTPISTGKADANGAFSAKAYPTDEVEIEFTDCSIKCFAKPGSAGLNCDPVANAVVAALTQSLGADVKSSSLFEGLSIAKIAEGMVETLKLISRLDPTNSYTDRITDAGGNAATLLTIIQASPVGTLFNTIGTLAQEKKAENEALNAGQSAADAQQTAAETSWTMENIVEMLTGMGVEIMMSFNDGSNGPGSLYDPMFANIDSWTNSDFVARLKQYVDTLYTTQYVNNEVTNVSMLCVARDQTNWDKEPIYYPPFDTGATETVNYGTPSAPHVVKKLSCLDTSADNLTYLLGISNSGGTLVEPNIQLQVTLASSFTEENRNDPTGTRGNDNGYNKFYMGFLDVFQEVMDGMSNPAVCGNYVVMGVHGPESFTEPAFSNCFTTKDKDGNLAATSGKPALTEYFAGLMGIYKFLRNPEMRNTKFSLDDLWATMSDRSQMGMRFKADLWRVGMSDSWVQISKDGDQRGTSAYMLKKRTVAPLTDSNGKEIYDVICPAPLCVGGVPAVGTVDLSSGTNEADLLSAIDNTAPSYNSTMGMFQNIPSMDQIKNSIFKDAHHEPYNIAGPKTFPVKGVSTGGDQYTAEAPILCHILNSDIAGNFDPGTSSIECVAATSVTWTNGIPSDTTTYAEYYALQERGGGNDGGDRYYGLISMNTGMDVRVNGRDFRIRGIKQSITVPGVTKNGSTVYSINQQFCDTYMDGSGQMQTNCWQEMFDYVAVEIPDGYFPTASYYPFSWGVPMNDGNGNQWNMQVGISQKTTPNDYSDDYAVCVKNSAVTVDANDSSKITAAVTLTGNLVDCFQQSGTYYYLAMTWGATDKASFKYQLVKNDGLWMHSDVGNNYEYIAITAVETALGGESLGPAGTNSMLNHYEVANLNHDPKFDPYCDDTNNNGICDCTDDDGDGQCTLADSFTETTLSEPPYWQGDPNTDKIKHILTQNGGKQGETLVTSLRATRDEDPANYNINNLPAPWNKLFECVNGEELKWVDTWKLMDTGTSTAVAKDAGDGCGTGGVGMGEIRMRNPIERNNAYNIARPNTLLKQISAATASCGTGVTIGRYDAIFNFQEAMALTFLRSTFPPEIVVRKDGVNYEVPIYFAQPELPGKHSDPSTGLLRGFMEKAKPGL